MEHVVTKQKKQDLLKHFSLRIVITIVLASLFFTLTYFFDNKFTRESLQAENGLLTVDTKTIDKTKIFYLTEGWAIYQDQLLTPETIDAYAPTKYVDIGDHHTMSFGDEEYPEHGYTTYRMMIDVSNDHGDNVYTLQLPAIYSAYHLYINGELMLTVGTPEKEQYEPQIYSTEITFSARNRIDIIVAVADWTNYESGIVSPLAFGRSSNVNNMVSTRMAVQAILIGSSLMLGIVLNGLRSHLHKRPAILMLCLIFCIIGLNLFSVVSAIRPVGIFWFYFDTFCFYAIFFVGIWLNSDLCHIHNWFAICIKVIDATLCILSVAIPLFYSGNHSPIHLFHEFAHIYKYFLLVYLTISCVQSLKESPYYASHVIYGLAVFAVVAVFNLVTPKMSNILLSDPLRMGCFIVIYILGFSMAHDSVYKHRRDMVWTHGHYENVINDDLLAIAENLTAPFVYPEHHSER